MVGWRARAGTQILGAPECRGVGARSAGGCGRVGVTARTSPCAGRGVHAPGAAGAASASGVPYGPSGAGSHGGAGEPGYSYPNHDGVGCGTRPVPGRYGGPGPSYVPDGTTNTTGTTGTTGATGTTRPGGGRSAW